MNKHKKYGVGYDTLCVFQLRMKLILKDRITLVVLLSSILIFSFLIQSLSASAETQSAIPIGIVNYDESQNAKELILQLKKVPALKVVEKDEQELHKLLLDELITSYFVIEEGYGEKLRNGDLHEIIQMYYGKNNKSASIISDIVAGEMMYSVCYYKSYRLYEQLPEGTQRHSASEYAEYMQNLLKNSTDFDFAFQMNYIDPKNVITKEEPISNTVLYNQLIFGILGILIAFVAMFINSGMVLEKEAGVERRLRITSFNHFIRNLGNFIALIFTEVMICLVFSGIIITKIHSLEFKLWISLFTLMLLNALVMGGIFLLLTRPLKSMALYQIICSALILITGGLGFYHLLSGFYPGMIQSIIKFIPNSWFIQGFTDIIIFGKTGGILKEGHWMLLLMAAIVITLLLCVDLKNIVTDENNSKMKNRTVN